RVLAAELEMDVLQAVGRGLRHLDSSLARARERDHRYIRMRDDRVTDLSPTSVDDVDDARRNTRVVQQLDEALAERRRVRRRLEDDGVSADERRQDLPGGNRDREVPRRDHTDDTDRLAHAHVELVAELGRGRLAEQP